MKAFPDPPLVYPQPQQTLRVVFSPLTLALEVETEGLTVVPGTRIFWEFVNLPLGFAPWLRFESDGQAPLGPFPALSQLSSTLIGEVPPSAAGKRFAYRLLVRSRTGATREKGRASIWSAELTLEVAAPAAAREEAGPRVEVTPEGATLLQIQPKLVVLSTSLDALVAFRFSEEILHHATGVLEPRIEFLKFTPPGGREAVSPPLGPFTSLIFSGDTIWGTGDAGRRGLYNYQAAALRQSTGEVVWSSSTDPVIDDQREPPPAPVSQGS